VCGVLNVLSSQCQLYTVHRKGEMTGGMYGLEARAFLKRLAKLVMGKIYPNVRYFIMLE